MHEYGLIGYPLTHSFSQKYFTEKFLKLGLTDYRYFNYELADIKLLPQFINTHPHLKGFNVTIPHKQSIIAYLDDLDSIAREVEAVNTVRVISEKEKKFLMGYNTDVYGFEESFSPLVSKMNSRALILGTGGASKAAAHILKKLNIAFQFVSGKKTSGVLIYDELSKNIFEDHLLIVNTTPLGTFPDTNECPVIPYQHLTQEHICIDLIYNPTETLFLKKAKQQGAQTKNGLQMLQLQADKAWEIWDGEGSQKFEV